MKIAFSTNAWEDYQFWVSNDKKIVKRINNLLEDIKGNPNNSNGIGKPERLKENYQGYFSRRITSEHRLVYKLVNDFIVIAQCRFYY